MDFAASQSLAGSVGLVVSGELGGARGSKNDRDRNRIALVAVELAGGRLADAVGLEAVNHTSGL